MFLTACDAQPSSEDAILNRIQYAAHPKPQFEPGSPVVALAKTEGLPASAGFLKRAGSGWKRVKSVLGEVRAESA